MAQATANVAKQLRTASRKYVGNKLVRMGKKVVAVGRNYADHAKEMGAEAPSSPVIFLKPTSSYVLKGSPIRIPPGMGDVHHEVELGVVIGSSVTDVPASSAMKHVAGYVLALDMTARDLQATAKSKGLPWTQAKCYDTFTPLSDFVDARLVPDPHNLELWLSVDGEMRQKGHTAQMIFTIPKLIEHISSIMTLESGDIILTGTPSGVAAVHPGQVIKAGITGVVEMEFSVKAKGARSAPPAATPSAEPTAA